MSGQKMAVKGNSAQINEVLGFKHLIQRESSKIQVQIKKERNASGKRIIMALQSNNDFETCLGYSPTNLHHVDLLSPSNLKFDSEVTIDKLKIQKN